MENFTVYNPVKLHFGRNSLDHLAGIAGKSGKNCLLVYGKGSIKNNGIYHQVINRLSNIMLIEYSGIKANPVIEDVENLSALIRQKNIDFIVAVGGGSVIDSAKIASVCGPSDIHAWDFAKSKAKPGRNIPLICVLTLAATGTEMNPFAVVQNNETHEKIGFGNPFMYPAHSILDPSFTLSVPADQTGYGIADLVAHALESWFGYGDSSLTDRFIVSIIREAVEYGPKLISDLQNYDMREKIMWAATCALNGMTLHGKKSGEWGVHDIGHTISCLFDTPHGATLSIAYPAWMKLMAGRIPDRISTLGKKVLGTSTPENCISAFEKFFVSIGCPVRLSQAGINSDIYIKIEDLMVRNGVSGMHHELDSDDLHTIVQYMI